MSEIQQFTSTGRLGEPHLSQDNRLRQNAAEPFETHDALAGAWNELAASPLIAPNNIGRLVFRGITNRQTLHELKDPDSPLKPMLEAAIPLDGVGEPNSFIVYLGNNIDAARQPLVPISEMREKTLGADAVNVKLTKKPFERVRASRLAGNLIATSLPADPEHHQMLHDAWGGVFGWEPEQIAGFAGEIDRQKSADVAPSERTLWLTTVYNRNNRLVFAAQAERLQLQGFEGPINAVESTEWSALPDDHDDYEGGHSAAALSANNAQVFGDLRDSAGLKPVIYAECNFSSRADIVGSRVGYATPSREYANQILPQNVTVTDGQYPPGLRDFVLTYIPRSIETAHYNPKRVAQMMRDMDVRRPL